MRRGVWRIIAATCLCVVMAGPAWAGAWIGADGVQAIDTVAAGEREDRGVLESQLYVEAPFLDDYAFVAQPRLETWAADGSGETDWRGEASVGVKRLLARGRASAMAVQASALWRSNPDAGCGEGGGELRGLAGVAFGRAFLNAEAGARVHDGGCAGGRLDFTLGYRPTPHWLGLAETFFDAPHESDATVKMQVSLVRFSARGAGVQIGLRARLNGDEAEPALVVGFWRAPRD